MARQQGESDRKVPQKEVILMMKQTKPIIAMVFAAAFVIVSGATAHAQDVYKDRTLTFIVGYSPGGT